MTVPANVQDWTGNGPSGCFTLHGGDTVPPELEAIVPDSWKAPAAPQKQPQVSPAPASGSSSS